MMKTTALLRRSILSRAASIQQTSKRSSFLACLSPSRANSCHFFSSSPDYASATHDHSWQQYPKDIQQPYLNGGNHHDNGSDHLVIKNLAGQEFAHLDNSHHGVNNNNSPLEGPRTSVLMELPDRVGALHDVLKY